MNKKLQELVVLARAAGFDAADFESRSAAGVLSPAALEGMRDSLWSRFRAVNDAIDAVKAEFVAGVISAEELAEALHSFAAPIVDAKKRLDLETGAAAEGAEVAAEEDDTEAKDE